MFSRIKTKVILSSIFLIILSTVIPNYILIKQLRENFEERSIFMLNSSTEMLIHGLFAEMMKGDKKNIQGVIDALGAVEGVDNIRIFNEEGIILYASDHEEIEENLVKVSPFHETLQDIHERSITPISEEGIYSVTEPIKNELRCQSCHKERNNIAYLDIDSDFTSSEYIFYFGSALMPFLGLIVLIILIIGLILIFNHFINTPLKRLILGLQNVENENLNVSLPTTKKDELGVVFNHFNSMVSNLKSSKEKIDELHFEELQRMNRLKTVGELTSQMAHEINNHSAIIMSRSDYLKLEANEEPILKKYAEDLNVIMDRLDKITNITGNILRHSKKRSHKLTRLDLLKIIERSITILTTLLNKKNIKIHFGNNAQNTIIYADEIQIEQALLNLIKNSVEAIDADGVIIIELNPLNSKKLELKITDTGSGIDEETKKHIYSPFFTSKANKEGTGLGLYIVKNICANNAVEIDFSSEAGKGTTFKLTFNLHV